MLKNILTLDEIKKLNIFPKRGKIKHIGGVALLLCLIILFMDSLKMFLNIIFLL